VIVGADAAADAADRLTALAIIRAIAECDQEAFNALWPWDGSPSEGVAYHLAAIAESVLFLNAQLNGQSVTDRLDEITDANRRAWFRTGHPVTGDPDD